jgi:hypothetical protein
MTVRINDNGAIVRDPGGVAVAVAVNADAASQEFLRTLNSGTLPAIVPLTPAELEYMMSMAAVDSRANANLALVYDTVSRAEGDLHACNAWLGWVCFGWRRGSALSTPPNGAGETPDSETSPREVGVDCSWLVTRDQWAMRSVTASDAFPPAISVHPFSPDESIQRCRQRVSWFDDAMTQ